MNKLMGWNEIGKELGISGPYAYTLYKNAIKKMQDKVSEFSPEEQEMIEDELKEIFTKGF